MMKHKHSQQKKPMPADMRFVVKRVKYHHFLAGVPALLLYAVLCMVQNEKYYPLINYA